MKKTETKIKMKTTSQLKREAKIEALRYEQQGKLKVSQSEILFAKKRGVECIGLIYSYPISDELKNTKLTTQNSLVNNFVSEVQDFVYKTSEIYINFLVLRAIVLRRLRVELAREEE